MKGGRLALSFGYLTVEEATVGDINELREIDLFEISVVSAPAHPGTRFLNLKVVATALSDEELRERAVALGVLGAKSAPPPVRIATFDV